MQEASIQCLLIACPCGGSRGVLQNSLVQAQGLRQKPGPLSFELGGGGEVRRGKYTVTYAGTDATIKGGKHGAAARRGRAQARPGAGAVPAPTPAPRRRPTRKRACNARGKSKQGGGCARGAEAAGAAGGALPAKRTHRPRRAQPSEAVFYACVLLRGASPCAGALFLL